MERNETTYTAERGRDWGSTMRSALIVGLSLAIIMVCTFQFCREAARRERAMAYVPSAHSAGYGFNTGYEFHE